MRLTIVLVIAFLIQVRAACLAQKITLSKANTSLKSILKELKTQSGYSFFYTDNLLKDAQPVDINVKDKELEDVLSLIFANQPLSYIIRDKTVVVIERAIPRQNVISGSVTDKKTKAPLEGVTVTIKGTKSTVQTDRAGKFVISIPAGAMALQFTYIGYKPVEIPISPNSDYRIAMTEAEENLKDVVVTGMVERKASTFTGAAKTFTGEELRQLSPTNLFAALQMVEPAFNIKPNNQLGSDINALPDIVVRGEGSFPSFGDQLAGIQNLPLFILDGFEVSLRQVADLDMNRIASITILKDASSTSMYGARGANGVMVITTIVPPPGKLEVNFSNAFTFSAPDLSVYNLLNAAEKLNMEERVGLRTTYEQQYRYAVRYKAMLRGADTDWKQIPTQSGYNNRTTLGISGGDQTLRYNIGFNSQLLEGVMKGQNRNNYSGNFTFSYNVPNKFNIRNTTTATQTVSNASNYGSFSTYLSYNPYTRPYNQDGTVATYIEDIQIPNTNLVSENSRIANPLANTKYNTINNRNKQFTLINQTSAEVFITNNLRVSANVGLNRVTGRIDNFKSAYDSEFANTTNVAEKGRYSVNSSSGLNLEGQARAAYNNRFGRHILTANANFDVRSNTSEDFTISATGFPFDKLDNLTFASQYTAGSKPSGIESTSNSVSYGTSVNYSFDNRYFADFSYNRQGNSSYGENNKWAPFWSAGLGWNIHNEKFFTTPQINSLRIRGSYGSQGSSPTDPYAAQFRYNFGNTTSYYGDLGAQLAGLANLALGPQNRLKANIGFDASLLKTRLSLSADLYQETTQNSLATVSIAPSTGFSNYTENVGKIQNRGINFDASYMIIDNRQKLIRWTLSINGASNKSTLLELSQKMKAFNDLLKRGSDNTAIPQFIEGNSMTAIYTVPSLGVDPITGQEIYIKQDGTLTYLWNTNDRRLLGDSNPTIAGNVNSVFSYRGFSFRFSVRYDYGSQAYNSTLASRVEGVNVRTGNLDRRAYDLGWIKPGDVTRFKRITDAASTTRSTSRLLQDNNSIEFQSISAGYTFENTFVKRLGLKSLSLNLTTNSTVRWSTIRVERGTDNPFSREFTFNLSTRF